MTTLTQLTPLHIAFLLHGENGAFTLMKQIPEKIQNTMLQKADQNGLTPEKIYLHNLLVYATNEIKEKTGLLQQKDYWLLLLHIGFQIEKRFSLIDTYLSPSVAPYASIVPLFLLYLAEYAQDSSIKPSEIVPKTVIELATTYSPFYINALASLPSLLMKGFRVYNVVKNNLVMFPRLFDYSKYDRYTALKSSIVRIINTGMTFF